VSNIPWLPDPADYAAPANGHPGLPHPSKTAQTGPAAAVGAEPEGATEPVGETPATEPVSPSVAEAEAEVAKAVADVEAAETAAVEPEAVISPFPPAPPTIAGDQITENVNQAGPAA
jgi:hypothetical protein